MRLPRRIKNSLLPLLLVFAAQKLCAQPAPAADYFNSGAQLYISNNIPAALEQTESGLKIYPDDEKLIKLEKLLKQQQQSQQQQNQSNQQKSQSQKNSSQNQNQQKPDQGQQQQNQSQQQKDKQKQEQANSSGKQNEEKKTDQEAQASAAKEMSPQEAKQLLDQQKGNEQFLQLKPPGKPQDNQKPVKDW